MKLKLILIEYLEIVTKKFTLIIIRIPTLLMGVVWNNDYKMIKYNF